MNTHTNKLIRTLKALSITLIALSAYNAQAQNDALAPPSIGEQTKGKPAVAEVIETKSENLGTNNASDTNNQQSQSGINAVLNSTTTVTEHKRDNGQVYLIEFENSLGGKQYLDEGFSDGKIGSSTEDKESTNSIPKWKLGSW